jgi:hypothetical protein
MLFAFGMVAFAMMFGGGAMRFGCILVMLGCLIMFVSSHWIPPVIGGVIT